jgi:hypothetical protein
MRSMSSRIARALSIVVGAVLGVVMVATALEALADYFSIPLDARLLAQTLVNPPQVLGLGLGGMVVPHMRLDVDSRGLSGPTLSC